MSCHSQQYISQQSHTHTHGRAEIPLLVLRKLSEPCPLDADVRDLSTVRIPATQKMRLLRRRTEPTVRYDFYRA